MMYILICVLRILVNTRWLKMKNEKLKSVSYLLSNKYLLDSIEQGLTPTAIYLKLIESGVVNPSTNKPYSLMTIRRLIEIITGGTVRAYIDKILNKGYVTNNV